MLNNVRSSQRLWLWAYGAAFLGFAAVAWLVRDAPVQPDALGGLVRVDALSAFFGLLAVAGGALLAWRGESLRRVALATLALLAGYCVTQALALAGALLLATLLTRPASLSAWRRAGARALADLLAPVSLLLACAALWLGGAWRYDAPAAGAAFSSLVFWLVLMAALAGGATQLRRRGPLASMWLYPLLRLYSLGPWNTGWSFATLLLGGAAALWCAAEATRANPAPTRARWVVGAYAGVALAGAGLSSAAGVAACCYALICALLLLFGLTDARPETRDARRETRDARPRDKEAGDSKPEAVEGEAGNRSSLPALWPTLALATLSGALPITAPFVALWLGVGAAVAGGVPLLSVALWLAGLGAAFATLHTGGTTAAQTPADTHLHPDAAGTKAAWRQRVLAAALSVALGVAAPAVVAWPIMPVARQLGGGLTPYGDLAIWPWVGLAALDAARQPVSSLPSAALAGLMLVLGSLAWLFTLLRSTRRD